ncbi:MAG: DnaA/Hda family protein [Desulfohalobiaceae bacterium]
MESFIKHFKNSILSKNYLVNSKWIEYIQLELNSDETEVTVYFPHYFIYQIYCDIIKNNFENHILSNFPYLKKINHTIINKTENTKKNYFNLYEYNPNYLFQNFLYNSKNIFAITTAKHIIQNDNETNKIVIYGKSGTGKTHLLKAILNNYIKNNNYKILYINPHLIFSQLQKIQKNDSIQNIFQNFDIVCIDDFDTLTKYKKIIPEVSYFIHYCSENNQKALIAYNELSAIYQKLDSQLRSRLKESIHVHLHEPDLDIRIRYIENFSREKALHLSDDQIMHLARQFTHFRNLEKILDQLTVRCDGQSHNPTSNPDSLLQHTIRSVDSSLSTPKIISELSDYFRIPRQDILSGSRRRKVVLARQIGMTICRQVLDMSYPRIGEAFGGRDHSTVMHSVNKILGSLERDRNLQTMFETVKQRCEQVRISGSSVR